MSLLRYRAGRRALLRLRDVGFGPDTLRILVAPAVGPKWLVVMGLDQALIAGGYLNRGERKTLLGASAGAWRSMALAARDPAATHRALCECYLEQRFSERDNALTISAAYRKLLARVFPEADIAHALAHPNLALGLWVTRARGLASFENRRLQWGALGAAGAFNILSGRTQGWFFERTLFSPPGTEGPGFCALSGRRVPLVQENAHEVLLASGSVPLVMAAVRNLPQAPRGQYLDGGLTDYHISQPILSPAGGLALLLLHQDRIIPKWFDKWLPHRRPKPMWLQDVILVHPSREWIARLPGGEVPTRNDFMTFRDAPDERIRRWRQAIKMSEELGEQLLADATAGRIPDLVQPL